MVANMTEPELAGLELRPCNCLCGQDVQRLIKALRQAREYLVLALRVVAAEGEREECANQALATGRSLMADQNFRGMGEVVGYRIAGDLRARGTP